MEKISVLIVDDHTVVRKGIQMILSTEPGIQVVGEARDGQEAFEKAAELQPDVILMDLAMPRVDGIDAIATIKRHFPRIKIIVLTTFADKEKMTAAIQAGADGYQLKEVEGDSLLQALQSVQRGEMPIHPRVTAHLVNNRVEEPPSAPDLPLRSLTEREKQVLQHVANGESNREIATQLSLSNGTIKVHVSNILNKLDVTSRTEAAVLATKLGLISLNEEASIGKNNNPGSSVSTT
ncbi:MAG TPA: response regulator transcription factor [Anaerolineae bacterium]|nr:response regulator transcription factor [Anaerolineae bacterium]